MLTTQKNNSQNYLRIILRAVYRLIIVKIEGVFILKYFCRYSQNHFEKTKFQLVKSSYKKFSSNVFKSTTVWVMKLKERVRFNERS